MPGLGFDILLVFTVMVLAWLIFVGWVAGMILRGIWRGLRWMLGAAAPPGVYEATAWRWCSRIRCGATNPPRRDFAGGVECRWSRRRGIAREPRLKEQTAGR